MTRFQKNKELIGINWTKTFNPIETHNKTMHWPFSDEETMIATIYMRNFLVSLDQ